MILKNKVYTAIEFLDLVCNHSQTYTYFERDVEYTLNQIDVIINGTCFEVLWNYPLYEEDYLNETHPDDTYVIVEALYDDAPVKRFFELPSNSAILMAAIRNDKAATQLYLMVGRHNCKSKMLDEAIKTKFNKAMDFTAWRDSSKYEDTDTVFADNLPPSTVVPYHMAYVRKHFGNDIRLGRFMEAEAMIKDHNERIKEIKEMIKDYEKRQISDVIFNDPATIVFWRDGSKTVVKAQDGEPFDKEKGLAMAYVKKCCGNLGNYNDIFRKWCKEEKNE